MAAELTCKQFARHIAGAEPLDPSITSRYPFWLHWFICPFCRRYWREIREIGRIQRKQMALSRWTDRRLSDFKKQLKQKLTKKTTL